MTDRTALILGASGRFGRHTAAALHARGWTLRRFDRAQDDLMTAAQGADVIVQGWNPLYPEWAAQIPQQTAQVIAAAEASGAHVILPGNVYVYGHQSPELMQVETPHAATRPLGRIRVEMEAAWRASSAKVTVVRAGDYIDTEATGNWFDKVITAKADKGLVTYPGATDRVHAWAWLPDVAEVAAMAAEQGATWNRYTEIPVPGYSLTGAELCDAIGRSLGRDMRLSAFPWMPVRAMGLVAPMMRCLVEMRYLWDMPHRLDPEPLDRLLPDFQPTPLHHALAQSSLPRPKAQPIAARVPNIWVGHARIV